MGVRNSCETCEMKALVKMPKSAHSLRVRSRIPDSQFGLLRLGELGLDQHREAQLSEVPSEDFIGRFHD